MRGPAPSENPRRRNAPTIPTTKLPAGGRPGRAPKVPSWIDLGKAGKAWWAWAWKTPQAAAWSAGDEPFVARRASLEDDLAVLADVEGLDFGDLVGAEHLAEVKTAIRRLASLASNQLQVQKEMRELEDRLGLNPKAMTALRWKIAEDEVGAAREQREAEGRKPRRLKAVDSSAG